MYKKNKFNKRLWLKYLKHKMKINRFIFFKI